MRLAFVDLETTGGSPVEDRITEVGIIEVDLDADGPGLHPVREWSALVNPDAPIPPFIETLTGITNAMVAGAPRFEELADDIRARLDGRLFIAHNARFDHGFLKNAFRRLGHPFRPPVLCTVRLSRKLYPGYSRHNLDTLIERHRLVVDMRHRALGDARLLWQLWQRFHDALPGDQITAAIDQLTARPSLPRHLDPDILDTLPKTAGVYLFLGAPIDEEPARDPDAGTDRAPDQAGPRSYETPPHDTPSLQVLEPRPLYIGKAKNLRARVMAHFTGDHLSAREMEISQQMTAIDWIETGGGTQQDLGALLTEAVLVKSRMPAYNRQLRKSDDVCAWRLVIDRRALGSAAASAAASAVTLAATSAESSIDVPATTVTTPVESSTAVPSVTVPGSTESSAETSWNASGAPALQVDARSMSLPDELVESRPGSSAGPDVVPDIVPHVVPTLSPSLSPSLEPTLEPTGRTTRPIPRLRPPWRLALARPDDLFFAQDPDLYGPFATPRQAGVALRAIADAHGLCPVLLKLDKGMPGKPCFSHQVKRCRGACVGLETVAAHTGRLQAALASMAVVPWPFDGPVAFREGHVFHVVDGWAYLGMAPDLEAAQELGRTTRLFDHDIYRLLVGRIASLEVVPL